MGTLFIVPTPIGNLEDLSERAAKTIRECDIVACEDTRVSSKLTAHLGVSKEFVVYSDVREAANADYLLQKLQAGKNVALVSDAGTPCISDPGFRIVRLCRKNQINVVPLTGPCAFTTALSASGLPTNAFLFLGFLPPKTSARIACFTKYANSEHTLIFYESVHRITKFVDDALEVFGPNRAICIAKELTKMHERFFTGTIESVRQELLKSAVKGEFVVIIAPEGYQI